VPLPGHAPFFLEPTADRGHHNDALAAAAGGRAGLDGVLSELDRTGRSTRRSLLVRRPATGSFAWDLGDDLSRRWWPQGITTSADAGPDETFDGRHVVLTSAYSQALDGVSYGARISVVDLTDPGDVRYRHVLLVEPWWGPDGRVGVRPVHVHAGGIVWHGEHLHVAGTRRGFCSFRLTDIVRVPHDDAPADTFGYRYLLPLRFAYDAVTADGHEELRYSFVSLDRTGSPHALVAGEYGRDSMTTRLARYRVDPDTGLLGTDEDGAARPLLLDDRGVGHTQGAVVVDGRWYLTTSAGRHRLGSVWAGAPGALYRHRLATPVGPEDLTYWPSTDELWSLSEYPGHRYVFAMPRAGFA
jgi:hypothetical protein